MNVIFICNLLDIEFWRTPSRRLYSTKLTDYEELKTVLKRKKLSLKKRRRTDEPTDVDESSTMEIMKKVW